MKPLEAIRCTQPTCSCECFAPGKKSLRYCDTCSHGWVSHALDKLGTSHIMNLGLQVEVVQPNIVFDIASLMLYGAHATPVRLKILLDRLFSVLQHEEVLQVLHGFGWTYEDYARGYILQDSSGRVLDKWCVATREEEMVVLQQFLRFGETKAIAQEIILQDTKDRHDVLVKQTSRAESDIKKFIERSNLTMQNYIKSYESTRQLFGPRSVPVPFIPPPSQVPRMMTPPLVSPSGFSVSPTGRETGHITPTSSRAHVPVVSTPTTLPAPTPSTQHSQPTQQPFDARKDHQLPNPATAALSLSPGLILPKAMAAAAVAAAQQRPPVAAENSPKNLSVRLPVVVPSASRASPSAQIIQQQSQTQAQQIQQLQLLQQQQLQQQQQQQLQQQQKQQQQQQQQQQSQQHQKLKTQIEQDIDEVDGGDGFGSCSDDEGEVIDYSTKDGGPESPSDGEKSNKQHNRKSSNPTKRQWTPSASFGSTLVGPNGKKRVLCTACNKTFCDKGALKIHYSAVHLKEMHKCTVEGCNMMFSSRRSRNRHSANPNPKLHMPQKRKDEMDQGDGTEMDLSTVSNNSDDISTPAPCATSTPTLPLPPSTSSGTPITAVNTVAGLPILDAPRLIRPDASFFLEMSAQFPFMSPPPTKRVKLDEEDKPTDLSKGTFPPATLVVSSEEGPCDLSSKKSGSEERKLEIDLDAPIDKEDKQPKKDRKETVMTGSAALAPAVIATVAAIAEESAAKSENGNRVGNRRKNNAPTRCAQKNESLSTSEENIDEKDISLQEELHISLEPVQDCDDVCQVDEAIKDNSEEAEAKSFPKTASLSSVNETNVELQNGAAAESLEKVGDVEKTDEKDFPCEQNDIVMLKEAQSSNTESEAKHKENDADDEGDGSDSDSDDDDDEAFSTADVNGLTGSQDYPPELYVDKDYPLTCKICGKVFQNSFTVKVHFQNVHLKLMHACTVNGCAATFPSKRSRDRHSANLNLHRKQVPGDAQVPEEMDDALRGNILARLYGMDYMGGGGSTGPNLIKNGNVSLPVPTNTSIVIQGDVVSGNNNNNNNNMTNNNNNEDEDQGIDKSKSVSQPDNTMSQAGRNGKVSKFPGSPTPLKLTIQPAGLNGHVSKPGSAGSEAVSDNSEDGDEQVDGKTGNLSNDDAALASPSITCQVCGSSFSNLLVLREHVGLAHPDHSDLDIDTEAVATRRSLSPRRARSRQRASRTVGLTTRKNSSSAS